MSRKSPTDVSASIRQRLLNLANERHEEYQFILTRYALERYLYRLSRSPHKDRFVLKGALLFSVWAKDLHRPTRDADFLGSGDNSIPALEETFRAVCDVKVPNDGVIYDSSLVRGERIRDEEAYQGVRVILRAKLGTANISVQIDIGFGDAVTPGPRKVILPTLLDSPAPHLRGYPPETVIAEKFETMVKLGIANSRMKDFYDIWMMARAFAFDGPIFARALQRTFERRKTRLTNEPMALSKEFAGDPKKRTQWKAFLRKNSFKEVPDDMERIIADLSRFLRPPSSALIQGGKFPLQWPKRGPWRKPR